MFKEPLLFIALALTGIVAVWGIVDTPGLVVFASSTVKLLFRSRGWFIMLTVSVLLIATIWLAFSPYGKTKLRKDDSASSCGSTSSRTRKRSKTRSGRGPKTRSYLR